MVMLLSTNAKRLLFGYLIGAYLSTIGLGLVIVFALPDSGTVNTSQQSVAPAVDLALGLLALLVAVVVGTGPHGREEQRRERRKQAEEKKGPPRWRKALDKGSPRASFAVGVVLSLPGASYLAALDLIHKQDLGTVGRVVAVIVYCLLALSLIEIPLLGYVFAPDQTVKTVGRFKAWLTRDSRRIATIAALFVGVVLLVRGAIEILS
jgi:Sap, sulfolipid-1-addressing protein